MTDIILIIVLIAVVGGASVFIYRSKKNGQACIGCPHSKQCAKSKESCGHTEKTD